MEKQATFPSEALTPRSPLDAMQPAAPASTATEPPPAGVSIPLLKEQIAALEQNRKAALARMEEQKGIVLQCDGALHVLRHMTAEAEQRAFAYAEEANRKAAQGH